MHVGAERVEEILPGKARHQQSLACLDHPVGKGQAAGFARAVHVLQVASHLRVLLIGRDHLDGSRILADQVRDPCPAPDPAERARDGVQDCFGAQAGVGDSVVQVGEDVIRLTGDGLFAARCLRGRRVSHQNPTLLAVK